MRQLILSLGPLPERIQSHRPAGFALAGVFIGVSAWSVGIIAMAALFPVLWLLTRSRREAGLLAFGYYLSGSWVLPGAAGVFFGTTISTDLGLVMWVCSALTLTLPWLFWQWRYYGLLLALLLVSLPPLGLIGWLNPLLAAADLFPGAGFYGLAGLLLLWGVVAFSQAAARWRIGALLLVGLFSLSCHLTYVPRSVPSTWKAVDTHLGKARTDLLGIVKRQIQVIASARGALESGAQLVLLPEQVTGWFDDGMLSVWRRELSHYPWGARQMLLVGAERPVRAGGLEYRNSLAAWIQGDFLGYVSARQTVPIAMWKPWANKEERSPSDWFKLNMIPVPVGKESKLVAAVFCYEELLTFPLLSTLAFESPYAIVSVVNGWWASPDEQRVQRQHIEAWAKLFNLPLLRAVNL